MSLAEIQQVVSFRLAAERYALDILNVQEIIRPLPITPVPLTPDWIAGVINLRGQIVPLIHLARRLGLAAEPLDASTRFIIVRSQEESIGLVVDQVMEVWVLSEIHLEPVTSALAYQDAVLGVGRLKDGIFMVLSLDAILQDYHLTPPLQEAV